MTLRESRDEHHQDRTHRDRTLAGKLMDIVSRHYQADGRHSFAEVRLESGRTVAFASGMDQ